MQSFTLTTKTCEVIAVQAGMCEIVFQLLVEFYYRLLLILEQKYSDTDKSITRGKFFVAINDNKKVITIKYRDNAQHCGYGHSAMTQHTPVC